MAIKVLVIHGIGESTKEDRGAALFGIKLTQKYNEKKPNRAPQIFVNNVDWGDITQRNQDKLISRLQLGDLWYKATRKMIISLGGDVAIYRRPNVYGRIHERIAQTLANMSFERGDVLFIVSHSLGTVIASDFVYDITMGSIDQRVKKVMGDNPTPIQKLENLVGFVTMGSPFPLYMTDEDADSYLSPIQVPHPNMRYLDVGGILDDDSPYGFYNLYSVFDPIANQLQGINEAYKVAVRRDVSVLPGGWKFMLPVSAHTGYWTDSEVLDFISDNLARVALDIK